MQNDDLDKLYEDLVEKEQSILKQLNEVATEDPAVKGSFQVKVKDYGDDEYDNAHEETDLDSDFPLVKQLETELRNVRESMEKIKNGTYGA